MLTKLESIFLYKNDLGFYIKEKWLNKKITTILHIENVEDEEFFIPPNESYGELIISYGSPNCGFTSNY